MELNELELWYWFSNIPGLGRTSRRKILDEYITPYDLYIDTEKVLKELDFLGPAKCKNIIASKGRDIKSEIRKLHASDIKITAPCMNDYPKRLLDIPDMPHLLYYKGQDINDDLPAVSIVGSRKCSEYGRKTAYEIGHCLAECGIRVISGMAYGVDGAAHRGCVDTGGVTYAVLGCGVNICYPGSNIELYMNILQNGSVISEYYPDTKPIPGHFPERNRIISGMSDIVIVVEAGEKSGSLITVDCALEQGKEIYAVPGRINDEYSKGCNNLIKLGASLYNEIDDIVDYFSVKLSENKEKLSENNLVLAKEERIVYASLSFEPKHVNTISIETGMELEKVIKILLDLEIKKCVRYATTNYYVKV